MIKGYFYRRNLYTIGCIALLIAGCRSSRTGRDGDGGSSAAWQQVPLTIDGSDSDWVKPLPYSNDKERIRYGITNDGENLYITLSTRDQQEQQKILQGGMIVWINNQAEKDYNNAVGIGFPTDSRNDRERQLMAQAQPDRYANKPFSKDDLKDYSLFGFSRDEPIQTFELGQENPEGIQVKLNVNGSGELIYEALVPLNAVFFPGKAIRKDARFWAGRNLAVGFFTEGLPPRPGDNPGGGGGGISIGGGFSTGTFGNGGGIGIGIGTGSLGRIGGRNRHAYKPGKVWQVVALSRQH